MKLPLPNLLPFGEGVMNSVTISPIGEKRKGVNDLYEALYMVAESIKVLMEYRYKSPESCN
jgi:hypothetical protein